MSKYRHEYKHEINYSDVLILKSRLGAVMQRDVHAKNGSYKIRSLYFDTPTDKALREKINGVNHREKFRLRYYDDNTDVIRLEKKSKHNGLGSKDTAPLTAAQAQSIVDGKIDWMKAHENALVRELYHKMTTEGLKPKTIVDYTREPFVYPAGNVRVTIDSNIRTGLSCTDFLNTDCVTVPAGEVKYLLEVKWDAFLPDHIRALVGLTGRHAAAFSKYAACRIYG